MEGKGDEMRNYGLVVIGRYTATNYDPASGLF